MGSSYVMHVDSFSFEKEVMQERGMVLIDFYADWCGPCKSLAPTLEKFAEKHKDTVKVVKINVDECPDLAQKYNIRSIPTLATVEDGRRLFTAAGALSMSGLENFVEYSRKNNPDNKDKKKETKKSKKGYNIPGGKVF